MVAVNRLSANEGDAAVSWRKRAHDSNQHGVLDDPSAKLVNLQHSNNYLFSEMVMHWVPKVFLDIDGRLCVRENRMCNPKRKALLKMKGVCSGETTWCATSSINSTIHATMAKVATSRLSAMLGWRQICRVWHNESLNSMSLLTVTG
jgi:hypothetical protein